MTIHELWSGLVKKVTLGVASNSEGEKKNKGLWIGVMLQWMGGGGVIGMQYMSLLCCCCYYSTTDTDVAAPSAHMEKSC